MKKMTAAEVREAFLDFFEEMGHKRVASSSLVPGSDPTLLFTNAGMVQFKDVFLGLDKRDYTRATTAQKCMRVSGKHNDLENVGPSPRHHTFFEMLGNFSFGDYFKRDAIRYAYELLTRVYELPPDRLVYTVYRNDDDAYNAWTQDIGVDPRRVARMGPKTNFWQMADTGPCGPTSEIHWDLRPQDGPDTIIPALQAESDRFLEIWNLVFMQFNRLQADPKHTGQFDEPLPAPGVDTGAGMERIVSILQGVDANYETDLFMPIIRRVQAMTGHTDAERDAIIVPYRVIADHMRAATFLIADGVRPGATGRDYICRMVIRRAVRFGAKLGFEDPFLANVADSVIDVMHSAYPQLEEQREAIRRAITNEEIRFRRAMDRALAELDDMLVDFRIQRAAASQEITTAAATGLNAVLGSLRERCPQSVLDAAQAALVAGQQPADVLDQFIVGASGVNLQPVEVLADILAALETSSLPAAQQSACVKALKHFQFPGEWAFRLHAEKGLPLEITRDITQEMGILVDEEGFREAQRAHEDASRGQAGGAFGAIDMGEAYRAALSSLRQQDAITTGVTQDQYGPLSRETQVLGILRDGVLVESASVGERVELVLAITPFYIEAGGQVSDTGVVEGDGWTVDIEDVRQPVGGLIVHLGEVVEGHVSAGAACTASVDGARRLDVMRNHTATHLLHAQLRAVLGTHVQQRGSLVAPDRLRFDFSHDQPISPDDLDEITHRINEAILADMPVTFEWKDLESARAEGAMALFGEKYGDRVRTVNIWQDGRQRSRYSYELCGGNHVEHTSVIGPFVIVSEGGVAQGIRRIEALTGHGAEQYIRRNLGLLRSAAGQLSTTPAEINARIAALHDDLRAEQHENSRLRRRIARLEFESLLAQTEHIGDVAVLVAEVSPTAADTLREMADWFRDKVNSGVVVLGMVADNGRPQLLAAATKDLAKRVHAGNIIREAAQIVGGGGGGRPDMAQAGGKDAAKLGEALQTARNLIDRALT